MLEKVIKKIFPKSHFHWQNLNELPKGRLGPPIEGRCWFWFDDGCNSLRFSWSLRSRFCHVELIVKENDDDICVSVAFPPIALWFAITNIRFRKWLNSKIEGYESKEIGLTIHDGSIWWKLWANRWSWSNKTPKWKDGNFNFIDFFFGKKEYNSLELENKEIIVPMPEKTYKGRIKLTEDTWKRPRWFMDRVYRAHVDMDEPIPFPGKGTMSYNCGDDALHGLTCPAKSIEEAIGKIVEDVLKTRRKRGSSWEWSK